MLMQINQMLPTWWISQKALGRDNTMPNPIVFFVCEEKGFKIIPFVYILFCFKFSYLVDKIPKDL